MPWPILVYAMASMGMAIGSAVNAGLHAALDLFGGSLLALAAGGGLRASLRGDRIQKIGGSLVALALMGLALWVSIGFSLGVFGLTLSGPVWVAMGFLICLVFANRALTD